MGIFMVFLIHFQINNRIFQFLVVQLYTRLFRECIYRIAGVWYSLVYKKRKREILGRERHVYKIAAGHAVKWKKYHSQSQYTTATIYKYRLNVYWTGLEQ